MDFAYEILLQGDQGTEIITGSILNPHGCMNSALEMVQRMEPNALQITVKRIRNAGVQPNRTREELCFV